jgi:hypothetical protein
VDEVFEAVKSHLSFNVGAALRGRPEENIHGRPHRGVPTPSL